MNHGEQLVRRVTAGVLFIFSLLLWMATSDVAALIAKERDVLLGRYSETRFTTLLVSTLVIWGVAWGVAYPSRLSPRQFWLRVAAALMSALFALVAVDIAWRLVRSPRYVVQTVQPQRRDRWPGERVGGRIRHRPPNMPYTIVYTDQPEKARSYPTQRPGYPTVRVRLTTDRRGYRNQTDLQRCDVVTLGDSFTEGSRVDDTESWPVRLARQGDWSVYNLGISGVSPDYYTNVLKAHGIDLQPKVVICMLYEGNDFRRGSASASDMRKMKLLFKHSPIRLALKRGMIRILGPINATGPVPNAEAIDWLPVGVPDGPDAKFYAFQVKGLTQLYLTKDRLRAPGSGGAAETAVKQLIEVCQREDIRLIVAYAPSKARVVLTLVRDRVTADQLHRFASFRLDRLPTPGEFKQRLYERLGDQEALFAKFCAQHGVEFVSPTEALRDAMSDGIQVYYTYDQHWTARGHAIVADTIHRQLIDGKGNSPPTTTSNDTGKRASGSP